MLDAQDRCIIIVTVTVTSLWLVSRQSAGNHLKIVCAGSEQQRLPQELSHPARLMSIAVWPYGSPINAILRSKLGMPVRDSMQNASQSRPQHDLSPHLWFGADGAVGYIATSDKPLPDLFQVLQKSAIRNTQPKSDADEGGAGAICLCTVRSSLAAGGLVKASDMQKLREVQLFLQMWDQVFMLKAAE